MASAPARNAQANVRLSTGRARKRFRRAPDVLGGQPFPLKYCHVSQRTTPIGTTAHGMEEPVLRLSMYSPPQIPPGTSAIANPSSPAPIALVIFFRKVRMSRCLRNQYRVGDSENQVRRTVGYWLGK